MSRLSQSFPVPTKIIKLCATLSDSGYQAYIVGGALRDILQGNKPHDFDLTTDATPDEIESLFTKTIPTGKAYGTITVLLDKYEIEITTMRQDGRYTDSRHPDQVSFTQDIKKDLARRDFTVNAIAYDPLTEQLIDPFQGIKHIKKKRLVCVGDPKERFTEDPLRMLRLIRFQATLGFKVDKSCERAIKPELICSISKERIQQELSKLLLGEYLAPAFELFYTSGLLDKIIPELSAGAGVMQGSYHRFDVLGHSIIAAQHITARIDLRWAALLHDVGKPLTRTENDGIHFYNHEQVGAELAADILRRLRYSNRLIEKVKVLVQHHMYQVHPYSSDKAFRRFIAKVGEEHILDLVKLRQADMAAMYANPKQALAYIENMQNRIQDIFAEENALTVRDLAITGNDIIKELDLTPGPLIGSVLKYLLDKVVDEPKMNNKQTLLQLARKFIANL